MWFSAIALAADTGFVLAPSDRIAVGFQIFTPDYSDTLWAEDGGGPILVRPDGVDRWRWLPEGVVRQVGAVRKHASGGQPGWMIEALHWADGGVLVEVWDDGSVRATREGEELWRTRPAANATAMGWPSAGPSTRAFTTGSSGCSPTTATR